MQQNAAISFGVKGVPPSLCWGTSFIVLSIASHRYSVLLAICLDGIIWLKIVEGSFTLESFTNFIKGLLLQMNNFPVPNSVIMMDNCCIHKGEHIRSLIETRYSASITISVLDNNECLLVVKKLSIFCPIALISAQLNLPLAG